MHFCMHIEQVVSIAGAAPFRMPLLHGFVTLFSSSDKIRKKQIVTRQYNLSEITKSPYIFCSILYKGYFVQEIFWLHFSLTNHE